MRLDELSSVFEEYEFEEYELDGKKLVFKNSSSITFSNNCDGYKGTL